MEMPGDRGDIPRRVGLSETISAACGHPQSPRLRNGHLHHFSKVSDGKTVLRKTRTSRILAWISRHREVHNSRGAQ